MKRLFTTLMGAALLLTLGATLATTAFKYPPGPSYRPFCAAFPDSITLYQIQQTDTTLAICHPATLDTVLGVRGVISGFDPRGTGYGFYFQNGTGPRSGANGFTGSWNYLSSVPSSPTGGFLVVGDSIVVYGRTQEFPAVNGWTEIEGPDGVQGTDDIIIRKISSGNPLYPKQVTTADVNWLPAFSQGEEWEGLLVKIIGPLKVGRTAGTGIQSGNFLLTTDPPTTDSVLVDQFTLTSIVGPVAPNVGVAIDSIYGIINQNTATINSYRLQIRSGNDLYSQTPPSLTDAYPIEDDNAGNEQIRLVFDKNLDPITSQQIARYSMGSAIDGTTKVSAVLEGGSPSNVVILTIVSVLVDGDLETVSALGVGSLTCPACVITPQQSRTFVNGVLTCARVQKPDAAQLPLYADRSQFAGTGTLPGTKLTVRGIGVKQYGALHYMVDEDGSQRGGLSVFAPISPISPGVRFRVSGQVQEFDFESEIVNTTLMTNEGSGTIPAPEEQPVSVFADTTTDTGEAYLNGEDFEGMLVKVNYVRVTETRTIGQSFFVAGQKPTYPDTILVSNLNGVLATYTPPDSAMTVDVTGILHYANGRFRICPRDPSDIVEHGLNVGVGANPIAELSFSVAPNPATIATLSFALPRANRVDLGVFDLQGRQVASLARGRLPAGEYTKDWAGTDASGRRVNPGMYFYRLRVGDETRTVRGILLQ